MLFYSQLYDLLPDIVPVAPGMFDELPKLDTMAWELEQSRLHPTCRKGTGQRIDEVLGAFSEGRSSFIDDDSSVFVTSSSKSSRDHKTVQPSVP